MRRRLAIVTSCAMVLTAVTAAVVVGRSRPPWVPVEAP
jgi:hypothetical protein